MARSPFDLERVDPDALRRVGATLRGLGYTEEGVRDRLGLPDLAALGLTTFPYYTGYRLRRRTPLDLAIVLLLLQGTVTDEELAQVLDADGRRALKAAGVLARDRRAGTVRARTSLWPIEDRLVFTDHRHTGHDPWLAARAPRDPVMYLGADTYYLARTTVRRQAKAVLDLCHGSGVHAVLAAATAERAVGVDVSARAVAFGRLNAMLNDAWNTVFLEGDLFGPVGGERFDLILANPPFVASPVYELTYRDGGPSGADVLRRIVASLPDFLAPGGLAQVVTHVAEREGESYLERVRRWLVGANMNMHALRLGEDDVVEYAMAQTRRAFGERWDRYGKQLVDWVTNLRAQRFHRVVGVVLSFEWNDDAPHPPWTQEDEVKHPPRHSVAPELARLFAAKKRVRRLPSLAALDRMRVGVPDDLLLVERRRPGGGRFEVKDIRVTFRGATVSPELEVKPLVRDLLERVDNRSTVPQLIARLARDTGQAAADLEDRCRRALVVMFERGLVTLDEVGAAGAGPAGGDAGDAGDLVRSTSARRAVTLPADDAGGIDPALAQSQPEIPAVPFGDDAGARPPTPREGVRAAGATSGEDGIAPIRRGADPGAISGEG